MTAIVVHDCERPEITDDLRQKAIDLYGQPAAWWRCPACGSSYALVGWYLSGYGHGVTWDLHTQRWEHARRPRRQRRSLWAWLRGADNGSEATS